ncbi:DNA circularization N-terminal domain-containing protein [Ferrovibrio terrae]|uniref:DNA circularization protein n=1 Tax=Ferrovibrio terrae TaxID=2594003 RepID=UPI0031378C54
MTEVRDYRQASFRGVPFQVAVADDEFGRRGEHHEFPGRDKGFFEDLGKKDPQFALDAYLVGDDYADQRDKLLAACDEQGLGELVHPYYGVKQVACIGVRTRHDKAKRRLVSLSLTFLETGAAPQAVAQPMRGSQVFRAADNAQGVAIEDFSKAFNLSGQPGFTVQELTDVLSGGADLMQNISSPVQSVSNLGSGIGGRSAFSRGLSMLRGTSLYEPFSLGTQLFSAFGSLSQIGGYGAGSYQSSRSVWSYGSSVTPVPLTTETRRIQASNQSALVSLFERAAIIEAGRSIPTYDFESYDEAVAVRDEYSERIDRELESTRSDDVFRTLTDLRAGVTGDVRERATDLARVSTITPAMTLPALVVAYDSFEDVSKADSIARRNKIRHPGFVPGGRPLEVLIDG